MKSVEAITLKPGDVVVGCEDNPTIIGTIKQVHHYHEQHARIEEDGLHSTPANWAGEDVRQRSGLGHKTQTATQPPNGKTAAIIRVATDEVYREKVASVSIQIGSKSFSVNPSAKLQKVS